MIINYIPPPAPRPPSEDFQATQSLQTTGTYQPHTLYSSGLNYQPHFTVLTRYTTSHTLQSLDLLDTLLYTLHRLLKTYQATLSYNL